MAPSSLIAIDVAIVPPPAVWQQAIELSAALPEAESLGLRLDAERMPHVTLTQQFVAAESLDAALEQIGSTLAGVAALRLSVTGAGRGHSAVWMAIAPTPALIDLHTRLMDGLIPFERPGATEAAFVGGDARPGDIAWVAGFRRSSSYAAFTPHITLGHASTPPAVEPLTFDATTIAACHLGRFCTCRRVLRQWESMETRPSRV
jgi:2'-5' RNA ligase